MHTKSFAQLSLQIILEYESEIREISIQSIIKNKKFLFECSNLRGKTQGRKISDN